MAEDLHFQGEIQQARVVGKQHLEQLLQQWSEAKVTLKTIIGMQDAEMFTAAHLGYTLFLQGKTQEARVVFEGLIAIDPHNSYYFRALGAIYWQQKEINKALRQFNNAIIAAPQELLNYIGRAEVLITMKRFAEAQQDLQRVIAQEQAQKKIPGNQLAAIRKAKAILKMI